MTAPKLKVGGIVRDDTRDGIARLRIDNYGNLYLDAEDLAALALMLANPPAVNHDAIVRQAAVEAEGRRVAEARRAERERVETERARADELKRLREQFPQLADQIVGPAAVEASGWRVFCVQGDQKEYLEKYAPGPFHTHDRRRAMRFSTRASAESQARTFFPAYLVEAP